MAGLSQFPAGLSHLAGLSQFPAGLSHLVGVSQFDLGHVLHVTRTHIRRRTPPVFLSLRSRSTASTTYKVHPRTICAPRLVSALLRGAYHTFGERCVARIAFGSRCTWALPGREARVHSLQFSCSQSSSKTTGWMVTLCRFAFLPGWGTGCGFL